MLLALASFASLSMVRVSDTLLPQIAADLGTTVGAASIVVTTYAIMHGSMQLVVGPIGDRFGAYRSVAVACLVGSLAVGMCGFAQSLGALALARLASGAAAAWIIPLSMTFIGDVTPYERRQLVLGRYLSGQISGLLFGQAAGGVLGDFLGWRSVFFLLAGLFALASLGLFIELATNPLTRPQPRAGGGASGFVRDYKLVLGNPWARIVIGAVLVEAMFTFGPFTFVGAHLHARFGLSFAAVGLVVAAFGAGGLLYALGVKQLVAWLKPRGLVLGGGMMLAAAFVILAVTPTWSLAPLATAMVGFGYYLLHNTLQTNATQMTPGARGTAVAIFSAALYLGQSLGAALSAPIVDAEGAPVVFIAGAAVLPVFALWFAGKLRTRSAGVPAG
ncbi:MAG: MFS transporter [Alphaproteobacteria bacterium]|nr:MFS transporter [Alphaproteobacteria bacterium]